MKKWLVVSKQWLGRILCHSGAEGDRIHTSCDFNLTEYRAGVSLITVLLFMLVATIAATATYKWITSEGRSSASRMMEREAYQSSLAGIESAISWMTYHANDVGALIRQYKTSGGDVSLDNQLSELVRPGQTYHVRLAGVNTEKSTYKLKLVSEGIARNGGASHTEVAILNVNGLYQVRIPSSTSHINFDKAFYGGSEGSTNAPTLQSGIINGNYNGNQPVVSDHLIVTGNATLQGSTNLAGADLYIAGDVSIQGAASFGGAGNVAYIGGSVTDCAGQKFSAGGDLLVEGNFSGNCGVDVSGNFTVGGILYRNNNSGDFRVGNNLVFKKEAVFNWAEGEKTYGGTGKGVGKNTYLSNVVSATPDNNGRKIDFGQKIYLYNTFPTSIKDCQNGCLYNNTQIYLEQPYENMENCDENKRCPSGYCEGFFSSCYADNTYTKTANTGVKSNRYFSFYSPQGGSIKGIVQSRTNSAISSWDPGDNILKNVSDNYWSNISNMNSLGHLIADDGNVPQPILVKNMANSQDDVWLNNKANKKCYDLASNLTYFKGRVDESNGYIIKKEKLDVNFWKDVQKCYEDISPDELFNGFLILTFDGGAGNNMPNTLTSDGTNTGAPILNGNFLFYFVNRISTSQFYLPPTTNNSSILLYLPNGAAHLFSGGPRTDDYYYNYFIYAGGSTTSGFSNLKVTGSVVMNGGAKVKFEDGNVNLQYNGSVLNALAAAGLIEENSDYTALANPGAAGSSGASIAGGGSLDAYYVAVAPQLSITVETQYANREANGGGANQEAAEGTFIVLPRIIYLSGSPKGSLDQYYNVIPLNSTSPVSSQSVDCSGSIPTSGKLVPSSAHKLTSGQYTCRVTGSVNGVESTVPFYVVVTGSDEGTPSVSFAEGQKELRKNDPEYAVQLKIPTTTGSSEEYTVQVSYTNYESTEWTVAPQGAESCAANTCTFKISSSTALHPIFKVTNNNATTGQIDFQIVGAVGCDIGSPYIESIMVSNSITVNRGSLADWCNSNGDGEGTADEAKCARKSAPSCESQVAATQWIKAVGSQCSEGGNGPWTCKNTASIRLEAVPGTYSTGCDVVIPGTNLANDPPSGEISEVTLFASLLAKPFTFTTGFATEKGDNSQIGDGQTIQISVERLDGGQYAPVSSSNCTYGDYKDATKNAEKCQVQVYYGDRVTLSFPNASDKAHFNYWMCESGTDCPVPKIPMPTVDYSVVVTGSDVVYAHFEESDKHCFFDEFRENEGSYSNRSAILCGASGSDANYCIDADGTHTGSKWKLVSGSSDDIEFNGDGRIALASKATRTKKESEKPSVTVMSRVRAGTYGTLKVQFQVPREQVSSGDIAKSTVKQSGFLLRSNEGASSYLMLNIFSDKDNHLKARICLDGSSTCNEQTIDGATVHQGDIILVAATIRKSNADDDLGVNDVLEIRAYTNPYSTIYQSVEFSLSQSALEGVQNLANQSYEYVGFRLSDQNFKIYGIGWKSDDYVSKCWDSYPIITCSFKAAYAGGIVPSGKYVEPWVGFSMWFGENGNTDCSAEYYYNGDDAGCNGYVAGSSDYKSCPAAGYFFTKGSSDGAHGYVDNGNDILTARAGASGASCTIYGERAPWANSIDNNDVAANCGPFWVGEFHPCTEHIQFQKTVDGSEGTYFAIDTYGGTANFREAEIRVGLDNTGASDAEVSVYLFSRNATSGYTYGADAVYSQPYTVKLSTGNDKEISIPVADISNVEGFDPERVVGAYVKYESSGIGNVSVHSWCPHALSLKECAASYDSGTDTWTVTATVNNSGAAGVLDVPSVNIGGSDNPLTSNQKNCVNSECSFTGGTVQEWTFTNLLDHTPYYNIGSGNADVSYQFTVTLMDKSSPSKAAEGSPCVTDEETVSKITSGCSIPDSKKKIRQGQGLPAMSYSTTGCPAATSENKKCGYTVKLMDGSSLIGTVNSSDFVNGDISASSTTTGYNTADNPLDADKTYKLILESTNGEYPFPSCEQEFEVTDANAATGNLTCDMAANVVPGQQNLYVSVTTSLPNQQFDLYIDDELKSTGWINGTGNTQNFTAPSTIRTHSYKITKNGSSEAECIGDFEVANPLSCSIRNPVRIGVQNTYVFSAASWASCSNCNYSNTLCSNCNGGGVADKNFTVTNNDAVTLSANCQCNNIRVPDCSVVAQAEVVAPTLDCDDVPNKINAEPGANVTITPISVGNCAGGCTYWVNNKVTGDKVTPETNGSITTQTSVTFPGESGSGENTYTLSVNNAKGTATCDVLVDYKTPEYTCPTAITAEPGTQITVTPTGVSYCSNGCSYSISGGNFSDGTTSGTGFSTGSLAKKIVDDSNPITGTSVTGGISKTYSLTLSNAAGAGTPCDITVNYMKPTYSCPENVPSQTVGASYALSLSPGNCTQGCNYTVKKGSATGSDAISPVTNRSYTSGKLGDITESTADTYSYYVTLSNPAGSDEQNCNFDIEFTDAPVVTCTCTCPTGCDNLNTSGGTSASTGVCYFATAFDIGAWNGTNVNVNGHTFSNSQKTQSNYDPIDGGYYIQFTSYYYPYVSMTGGTPVCGGGGGGGASSSSATPSSSSAGGGGGGGNITLTYGGDLTTITAGTYTVYSTNEWSGVMRCEADEQVTVTVDGASKTVYTYRSSLDGANPRTNVSVTLVVPSGKTIRCNTDW
ncbi:hypothetical protein [Fibrobacter sp.]|uniref:hypothetical protein n=1 Tax=Fibrobacter sp. TaxID=35828 RepID=UPI00388DC627